MLRNRVFIDTSAWFAIINKNPRIGVSIRFKDDVATEVIEFFQSRESIAIELKNRHKKKTR